MHQTEIREICYQCGHHEPALMEGSSISTDFCNYSHVDCGAIKSCDPSIRIPKKKDWEIDKEHRKARRKRIKKEPDNQFPVPENDDGT